MELYIPAILIVISAWLATIGNTSGFSDILAVLLSQLFLYFSYITVMPKVSDVKAMDVFLIACFGFIFIALMQTFINTEENLLHESHKVRDSSTSVDFKINDINVNPYLGSPSHKKKIVTKKRKNPKIKLTFFQSVCKYVTCRNFFLYAMYPTAFSLFCLFYFVTYMHILHHDDEVDDC